MSTGTHETGADTVYFSGKQAEEVGFNKFSERQAKLQGIHVLVLDRIRIQHHVGPDSEELEVIANLCVDITALDLSANLFESFEEITGLCGLFPKLRTLTLDGNRFTVAGSSSRTKLPTIQSLSLSQTLLSREELAPILDTFPSLEKLEYTSNELSTWSSPTLCAHLTTLDLSDNDFTSLSDIQRLDQQCPTLQTLTLQHNHISTVGANLIFLPTLTELSVSHNAISAWTFFNDLSTSLPHLRSLRVTGNPLYTNLRSAEGKPLTSSDGYMLTLARLRDLKTLNYSFISGKERMNAETYYMGQIAIELAQVAESEEAIVLAAHPRYRELCKDYGEQKIERGSAKDGEVDPRNLAARLVSVEFRLAEDFLPEVEQRAWRVEAPKSFDVYAVLGLVGKRLGVSPLSLELVLETGERDPMARDSGYAGPECWDSSDEDGEGSALQDEEWTTREVELIPSTRALGTYVEGREATVRVRLKNP